MQKAEAGGNIKRLNIGKKLLNNLGLKLISVIFAVVLWFLVVIADNPKETRTFANIPVTLTNVELLEKEDKVYEVLDNSDRVRVTVEVPRSDLDKLRSSDIVAEADMSKLTAVNTIAISFYVMNDDVSVSNITGNRDVVQLNVEDKVSMWKPVDYKLQGAVAENYMVAGVSLNQTRIEVSGAQSAVEKIDHAFVEFDVTGATTEQSPNLEIKLCDAEGKILDLPNVTTSADHIVMTVQVLAVKEVPIELSSTGIPAEGFLATGEMSCDPASVMIAGSSSALANISKISIPQEQLDITDAEESLVNVINLKNFLPVNVRLADSSFNGRVTATVFIEPRAERTLTIPEENISLSQLPEGLDWEFDEESEPCRLKISGLNAVISEVQESELYGTIDIGKWMQEERITVLKPGIYEVPVAIEAPENVDVEEEAVIQVVITEVKEDEV